MTKFMGLVVAFVAAVGVTLATPASSEACGWRRCGGCYVEPSYCPDYYPTCYSYSSGYYYPTDCSYSSGYYYPSYYYPSYSSGYYPTGRGFSGYYRVGNVIINGRRWGDIGYRYSHSDLIRW
jgi:hypothetical protein